MWKLFQLGKNLLLKRKQEEKKKKIEEEEESQQKPLDPFTLKEFPKHCCHQPTCILQGLIVSLSPVVLAWNYSGRCTDRHSLRLKTTPSLHGFVYRQTSEQTKTRTVGFGGGFPLISRPDVYTIYVTLSHQMSLNSQPAYCATGKSSQWGSIWVYSDFGEIKIYKH